MKVQGGIGRVILAVILAALLVVGSVPVGAFNATPIVITESASLVPAPLTFGASLPALSAPQTADEPDSEEETVSAARVLAQDNLGIELEFVAPELEWVQAQDTEGLCELPVIKGFDELGQAGAPALLAKVALVGTPGDAELELQILDAKQEILPGTHRICPVATPQLEFALGGVPEYLGEQRIPNAELYALSGFAPEAAVELLGTSIIRGQRVAEIRYMPLQYDSSTGQVLTTQRVRVRLQFGGVQYLAQIAANIEMSESTTAIPRDDAFDAVLQELLVNYEAARAWRAEREVADQPVAETRGVTNPQFKVTIRDAGLYRINYTDLTALDPDYPWETVDPRKFHLRNRGVEVALRVEGEGDGSFDPGDWIVFYGEKLNSKYALDNVYFLTWDDFDGLRMTSEDGTPGSGVTPEYFKTTRHLEVDYWYQTTLSSGDNDHWYWDLVQWSGLTTRTYSMQLQNVATTQVSATVRGLLHGYSADPAHQVRVLLNSYQVYSATWASGTEYAFSVDVPSSYVLEGANTIVLNRWGTPAPTADVYFVNWLELDYTRNYTVANDRLFFDGEDLGALKYRVDGFTSDLLEVYDITSPVMPVRIVGAQTTLGSSGYVLTFERTIASESHYLALATSEILTPKRLERDQSSRWFSPDNAADYIMITPSDFVTATQPLVDYHTSMGLRVEVVDVQDIYDEFGGGWLDPGAIRDFVAYAYASWEAPAPAYVLLIGDGNYDFKDNLGRGERNFVPPYLADVDPWMGETAADNRYVAVDGSDIQPDLHLGRLPVKTAAEVTTMVSKTLAYAADASVDAWKGQLLFVADDPDGGGNFRDFSDAVADYYVPAPYANQKVYYRIVPYTSGSIARTAIVNAINSGKLMVNYVGHSAFQYWASEQLINLSAIAGLTNTQALPFIMPMTCYEGYYVRPSGTTDASSVGESFVRKSGGGAIASWSPTGLGVANGHDIINKAFFQAVFYEDLITFGPATTLSKLALTGMGHDELIDTYVLFGDPALKLNTLPADVAISKTVTHTTPLYPGDWLTYTLAFTNTGPARANNVVIGDVFPSMLLTPTTSYSGPAIVRRPSTRFVWDVADLTPGASGRITVAARVPLDYAGIFTNTATITTTARELASATGNNSTVPVAVEVIAADVEMSKIGPSRALPGETIRYVLTYGNVGTTIATGVVITDLLHSHLLTPVVTFAGPTITPRPGQSFVWDVEPLPPGAQGRITITANVDLDYRGTVENQAAISTTTPEAEKFDNLSALISTAVLIPDLALEKTGPTAVLPGMDITYVVSYTNRGNAAATGVVITDVLPAAVESVTVLSAGTVITPRVGSAYVWDAADIAPDSGGVITITGTVLPTFRGDLVNTASIATELPDNDPANNADTLTTFVSIADLAVTKTGPAAALAGERITYTLAVANVDNALASGVVLTDTLPADLLDVTVTASVPGVTARPGSAYVWDVPDLAPGASVTLTVVGRISPTYRGMLGNQAMVATASPEASTTNNTSALIETFVSMADVMVEKTGPATVQAGGMVTYTLRYSNVDSGVATGVVLTDVLPSALVSVTVIHSGPMLTPRPGTSFAWTVADLAPGAGGVVTITASVRSDAAGAIVNTASIAAAGELNTGNNHSIPVSTQILLADVTLNKSAPATVESGAPVTYRLTFTNAGTTVAHGVVITDLLPAQLTGASFTSAGAGVSQRAGAPFVWDVVDLVPGASGIITITATVDGAFTGMLINTATIATSGLDGNPSNNSVQVSTQVTQPDYKIYLPLVIRQYP
ncbi:MAG: DUF11 domain-containing protein [Anaerolineae bacterium]|nr:DUF11 domain-containing protein [Anaerolineae bacterium]